MKRFRLQYFSDLHLERRTKLPTIVQTADTLLLAGDIGHPQHELYREFMDQCSRRYDKIYLVHGNHEWDRGCPLSFQRELPSNVVLLENQTVVLVPNRLTLLGCTLWTPTTRQHDNLQSIRFLQRTLPTIEHSTVCLTHHLPSFHLIVERYRRARNRHRFANNLDTLLHVPYAPQYWICGHSHSLVHRQIGRTQCYINTFGPKYSTQIDIPL